MARSNSGKSGFVIKLSDETVQKLAEEEQQAKANLEESSAAELSKKIDSSEIDRKPDKVESADCDSKDACEKVSIVVANEQISDPKTSDNQDGLENKEEVNKTQADTKAEKPKESGSTENSTWGDYAPYITYEGEEAIYTDPSTQQKYTWSKESNSWALKPDQEVPGRVYSYEDDKHTYTEADGSKFFWDPEKKAWIPKVDDDFLAYYQMSYGFVDNKPEEKKDDKEKANEDKKKEPKKDTTAVKRKSEPQWFQPPDEKNTKVYVSNLPTDLTEQEFVDFMQKCGLVERDPSSQKMKVKLYMDKKHNCFKGDALCTYIKVESVDLALKLLDGSDLKGNKVKVERAHFQMKGEYNPALKPKKKKKKELEKIKKMQQKLFDWRPEKFIGERSKHERVVIVKNLFHPTDFDKDVQLILDYQQDLREECARCGEVRKVVIYDRHPKGVAQITMKEPEMADAVVQLINGRWFGQRQITAEIWDGRTKYRIAETDSEISKRINKWDQFLEGKEGEETKKAADTVVEKEPSSTQKTPEMVEEKTEQSIATTNESNEVQSPPDANLDTKMDDSVKME